MVTASSKSDSSVKGFFASGIGVAVLALLAAAAAVLTARFPKLGVPALAAIPMVVLLLQRAGTATALFVFVLVVNIPAVASNFHGVPKVIAAAFIGLLAIPVFRHVVLDGKSIRFPRIAIVMALFQLLQFLGVLVAVRPDDAVIDAVSSLLEGFVVFLLFVNAVRTQAELRWALIGALVGSGFMGAITIHQSVTGSYLKNYGGFAQMGDANIVEEQIALERSVRHAGPIGEKNRFAHVLLLCAPFALLFFGPEMRRWLPIALMLLASTMIAFVLTRSRGCVIGLGVMCIALVIIRRVPIRHIVLAVVLLAPAVALVGADYVERVGSIAEVAINASSGSIRNSDAAVRGRLNEMGAAVLVYLDHPIMGVGPQMFKYHYREYAGMIGLHIHNTDRAAHCMYLQVAAEHGTIGFILFMMICWKTFAGLWSAAWRVEDADLKWLLTAILIAYVGYMTAALFLSFTFIRYFWFLLAISWVAIDLAKPANAKVA
jgi:O-antigen ligase